MGDLGSIGSVFVDIEGRLDSLNDSMAKAVPMAASAGEKAGQAFSQGLNAGTSQTTGYFQNINNAFAEFGQAASAAISHLQQFRPALDAIGADLRGLGVGLSLGLTAPLAEFASAAVTSASKIESLKLGLTAVTGSAKEAERQFESLRDVAQLPGLGLPEAVQGATRLQAFGFSAQGAHDILVQFGNAIASVGGGRAELDRVILQLGQMAGAGKVLTQDLRPIIEQVPQVATIIKREFGGDALTDPAKKIEALGISSQQFIETLVKALSQLPRVTGGLKNDLENFSDSITIALSQVGKSLEPLVHKFVEEATPAIQNAVTAWSNLSPRVQEGGIALAAAAAAAGPLLLVAGSLAKGLSDIIGIMDRLKVSGAALTGTVGELAAGAALIHFSGLDSTLLDMVERAAGDFKTLYHEVETLGIDAGVLERSLVSLTGGAVLPVIGSAKDAAAEISNLGDKVLSLKTVATQILGASGGWLVWVDSLVKAAASAESLTGKSKTMADAIAGLESHLRPTYDATQKLAQENEHLSAASQKVIDQQTQANQALQTAQRAYNEIAAAVAKGTASQESLTRATFDLQQAMAKAHPVLTDYGLAARDAANDVTGLQEKSFELLSKMPANLQDFEAAVKKGFDLTSVARQMDDTATRIESTLNTLSGSTKEWAEATAEQLRAAAGSIRQFAEDAKFSVQGIEDTINKQLGDAQKSLTGATGAFVDLYAKMQGGQATIGAVELAFNKMRSAFVALHPELKDSTAAFEQFLSENGLATLAMSEYYTRLVNGVEVTTKLAGGVRDLTAATGAGLSSTHEYKSAWSEAAVALHDADGNLIALTHDMQLAASMSKELAAAARELGESEASYASERSSAATPGTLGMGSSGSVDGIKLAGVAASYTPGPGHLGAGNFAETTPEGSRPGDFASFIEHAAYGAVIDTYTFAVKKSSEAAAAAAPLINQFGESLTGAGDETRNTAIAQDALNKSTAAAGESARQLQAQINQVSDQMQAMRDAGQQDTQAFSDLQSKLSDLGGQLNSASSQTDNFTSSTFNYATGVETFFDTAGKAIGTVMHAMIGDIGQVQSAVDSLGRTIQQMGNATQGWASKSFDYKTGIETLFDATGKVIGKLMHAMLNPTSTSFMYGGDIDSRNPGTAYSVNGSPAGYSGYMAGLQAPSLPDGYVRSGPSSNGFGTAPTVAWGSPGAGGSPSQPITVQILGGTFTSVGVANEIGQALTQVMRLGVGQRL